MVHSDRSDASADFRAVLQKQGFVQSMSWNGGKSEKRLN